jgi:hypothetical protein
MAGGKRENENQVKCLRTVQPLAKVVAVTRPAQGDSPGAGTRFRLPVRHKLHCEAPTGVADPKTTWSSELFASTQEGG